MDTLTMGTLKPGATYIYERAMGVTYAREVGAHPGDRIAIGWDADAIDGSKIFGMDAKKVAQLVDMAFAAESNPALQDALDRAIMLHELTKIEEEPKPGWHPV
jgi:hypothetical protein